LPSEKIFFIELASLLKW